jgi:hypothetical protein
MRYVTPLGATRSPQGRLFPEEGRMEGRLKVRSFKPEDLPQVRDLFADGMKGNTFYFNFI